MISKEALEYFQGSAMLTLLKINAEEEFLELEIRFFQW